MGSRSKINSRRNQGDCTLTLVILTLAASCVGFPYSQEIGSSSCILSAHATSSISDDRIQRVCTIQGAGSEACRDAKLNEYYGDGDGSPDIPELLETPQPSNPYFESKPPSSAFSSLLSSASHPFSFSSSSSSSLAPSSIGPQSRLPCANMKQIMEWNHTEYEEMLKSETESQNTTASTKVILPPPLFVRLVSNESELVDVLRSSSNSNKDDYVLVNFHAVTWCPFSQSLELNFSLISLAYPELCVLSLDADMYSSLNSRFGVHGFPTIILFYQGEPKSRYKGDRSFSSLSKWIEAQTEGLYHVHSERFLTLGKDASVNRFFQFRHEQFQLLQYDSKLRNRQKALKISSSLVSVFALLYIMARIVHSIVQRIL